MGLVTGIRLIQLDEGRSVAQVPYRWCNKNPFRSMYFAVQSMAAELSTAAPVFMALSGSEVNVAVIIVDMKAEFVKKAQSGIRFQCMDYQKISQVVRRLDSIADTETVTVKTVGFDEEGDEVSRFYFTWSFKRRS